MKVLKATCIGHKKELLRVSRESREPSRSFR